MLTTQSEDESEPCEDVVFPLGQLEHDVRSLRPYMPTTQSEQLVLDDVSSLPAAQRMHELRPALP